MLAYTSLDDAFSPLSTPPPNPLSLGSAGEARHRRRRTRGEREDSRGDTSESGTERITESPLLTAMSPGISPGLSSGIPAAPPPSANSTLMDEVLRMLPYMFILFMILVSAMLYDMRNTMHETRVLLQEFCTQQRVRTVSPVPPVPAVMMG